MRLSATLPRLMTPGHALLARNQYAQWLAGGLAPSAEPLRLRACDDAGHRMDGPAYSLDRWATDRAEVACE